MTNVYVDLYIYFTDKDPHVYFIIIYFVVVFTGKIDLL